MYLFKFKKMIVILLVTAVFLFIAHPKVSIAASPIEILSTQVQTPQNSTATLLDYQKLNEFFKAHGCSYRENSFYIYAASKNRFLNLVEIAETHTELTEYISDSCPSEIQIEALNQVLGLNITEEYSLIYFDIPEEMFDFISASSSSFAQKYELKQNVFENFQSHSKYRFVTTPQRPSFFN